MANTKLQRTNTAATLGTKCTFSASWMHVCLSLDSTLATGFDRIKIYINGELMTSSMYSTSTTIAQNQNWIFTNSGHDFVVGGRTDNSSYCKGSMAQTVLVDGQALAPTAFGAVNSATGIWGTISDADVRTNVGAFGNNGFFLTYENASFLQLWMQMYLQVIVH